MIGDLRSDLAVSTVYTSDSVNGIINFTDLINGDNALLNRAAYYKVVNECNFYLAKVDTMAKKNNIYFMRKEAAQVELIRAWTYMQLVQAYGSVPFITEPITEANSGLDISAPQATSDNLLDLLLEHGGILKALQIHKTMGYPDYGTFNTGAVNVQHQAMIFPAELVLADLYLLRGQESDYEVAANYYYEYLKEYQRTGNYHIAETAQAFNTRFDMDGKVTYQVQPLLWIARIAPNAAISKGAELLTVVPAAANHAYGHMLTRIPNIYGFDIHSYNQMGDETSNGAVTLMANYETRQVQPSPRYENLSLAQTYLFVDDKDESLRYVEEVGDARLAGAAPLVRSEDGDGRFIQKYGATDMMNNGETFAGSFKYRYCIPVYRYTQVMLRFAEAVNRAGFPRHAYAILMSGTSGDLMPHVLDSLVYKEYSADSTEATADRVYYLDTDTEERLLFIGIDEMRRAADKPYLDFNVSSWKNEGIHTLGSGFYSNEDTVRTYDKVVAQRVQDEKLRSSREIITDVLPPFAMIDTIMDIRRGEGKFDTVYVEVTELSPAGSLNDEINAVETLIADELALEMAFEGTRFYDLVRIARHMDRANPGYGTEWLAWTIARRSVEAAPYENVTEKDAGLYNILLSPANWYLPNP